MGCFDGGDDGGGSNEIQETALEKESSRIAQEQWADYATNFVPTENKFIASLRIDQNDKDKVAGQISGGVASMYGDEMGKTKEAVRASGVNPNSGKMVVGLGDVSTRSANAGGKALTRGSSAMDDRHYAGLQTAVSLGRGQATDAQLGISDIAGQEVTSATNDTINSFNARTSKESDNKDAVGTVVGMGTAAYLKR